MNNKEFRQTEAGQAFYELSWSYEVGNSDTSGQLRQEDLECLLAHIERYHGDQPDVMLLVRTLKVSVNGLVPTHSNLRKLRL